MLPEIGHFALILALALAGAQAFFGILGPARNSVRWMNVVTPAITGQFVMVTLAFVCLVTSFIENDFTVKLVAANSNTALPLFYRATAVWSNHEGSMLLWILVLAMWTLAVAAFSGRLPQLFSARVIGVLGFVSFGFLLFTLATSNPFERLDRVIPDGVDMNPLLQDVAFVIHPPMLYVGYSGFSVAFAFACAAMLQGKMDQTWARWTRPWTIFAWAFLSCGIALGSWWAYYELGWGGYWAWDPVENSIFIPWLVGTALIHSLSVTDKRGLFKSWTLLLAIAAFSLSLLATFLTRSGSTVSVHSFAADPTRGIFILAFLVTVIGSALALYAWRAPLLRSQAGFDLLSREAFLLFNNILLVIAAAVVAGGTIAPLVADALKMRPLSVGPPYFNPSFMLPMLPLLALTAVGMHANWKRGGLSEARKHLLATLVTALVLAAALTLGIYGTKSVLGPVAALLGLWIVLSALIDPIDRIRRRLSLPPAIIGMTLAHIGLGLATLSIAVMETAKIERDVALGAGESVALGAYEFRLQSVAPVEGPNYDAMRATVVVTRKGEPLPSMYPEKRNYWIQRQALSEAALGSRWNRDLLVTLGEDVGNGRWSLRVQVRPLIGFLWLGVLFMAGGGVIAAMDRRYRRAEARAAVAAELAGGERA